MGNLSGNLSMVSHDFYSIPIVVKIKYRPWTFFPTVRILKHAGFSWLSDEEDVFWTPRCRWKGNIYLVCDGTTITYTFDKVKTKFGVKLYRLKDLWKLTL